MARRYRAMPTTDALALNAWGIQYAEVRDGYTGHVNGWSWLYVDNDKVTFDTVGEAAEYIAAFEAKRKRDLSWFNQDPVDITP